MKVIEIVYEDFNKRFNINMNKRFNIGINRNC